MRLNTTPLHQIHIDLGARMMAFAGFDMPVQYSSIKHEHMAVRNSVGVFDVSHMGEFAVTGPHAKEFVQHLVSNDVENLYDGKAMYSVMCNEDGGIVDDLLVYRFSEDDYMLVVNASNIEKDFAWAGTCNSVGAALSDRSGEYALIAVQGPNSTEVIQRLADVDVGDIKFYHFVVSESGGRLPAGVIISRTGYTGETGFELYCQRKDAVATWITIFEAGKDFDIQPVGLAARDTLRLESGYCLYGNDISDETNPLEAGLGWVTKLAKGDFVGSDKLRTIKAAGIDRKLVAFTMIDRGIPRTGYPIVDGTGMAIGVTTSGSQSPILSCGIGMGYVRNDTAFTSPGSEIFIEVRGKRLKALVKKPPLHK